MLHLWTSNSLERLAGALAGRLAERHGLAPAALLNPEPIVVPNGNVGTFARLEIARTNGIAAHLAIQHWEAFLDALLSVGSGPERLRLLNRRAATGLLATLLADPGEIGELGADELLRYVRPAPGATGERDLQAYQLAERLANLFEEYQLTRPEMIAAWRDGRTVLEGRDAPTERWQSALWRRCFGPAGVRDAAVSRSRERWVLGGEVASLIGDRFATGDTTLPARLHVFGFSYLGRTQLELLRALADMTELHFYTIVPLRRAVADATRLHPALRMWGRPGLDHLTLIGELRAERVHPLFGPADEAGSPASGKRAGGTRASRSTTGRKNADQDADVQLSLFDAGPTQGEHAGPAAVAPPASGAAAPEAQESGSVATEPAVAEPPTLLARLRAGIESGRRLEDGPDGAGRQRATEARRHGAARRSGQGPEEADGRPGGPVREDGPDGAGRQRATEARSHGAARRSGQGPEEADGRPGGPVREDGPDGGGRQRATEARRHGAARRLGQGPEEADGRPGGPVREDGPDGAGQQRATEARRHGAARRSGQGPEEAEGRAGSPAEEDGQEGDGRAATEARGHGAARRSDAGTEGTAARPGGPAGKDGAGGPGGKGEAPPLPAGDRSVTVLACPGIQREVEVVAGKIWTLLREDAQDAAPGRAPLRFNDIAIVIADAARFDEYESHIRAVFQDMYGIPTSVGDVRPASRGRVMEALELLIALPAGRFRRPELLRLLTHPALLARFGRTEAADWTRWCHETAIYFGADLDDLQGLYIERDLVSWDQGLRRLALGAFLAPAPGGDNDPFELGGQSYVPEDVPGSELPSASLFTLLVRSLIAEARDARGARKTLAAWSRHYTRQVSTYLAATDESDEMLLARARRELGGLAEIDISGRPISEPVAAAIARGALARIPGGRGHYLADGVVVSALQPMRPIPFPVTFMMGLGEGRFPAAEAVDLLDIRRAARRAGDVTPRERDSYLFLEAIVSTGRRLYLSYVSRDTQTGDELNPSPVIEELSWMLADGAGGSAAELPVERHPLRRWEEDPALDRVVLSPRVPRESALYHADRKALAGLPRRERLALLRRDAAAAYRWLGLLPLSGQAATARSGRVDVSIHAIRRFLECPLQGWARQVLRLAEADVPDIVAAVDEPLTAGTLDASLLVQSALARSLAAAPDLPDALELDREFDSAADRMELAGRLPTGPFGRAERQRLRAILQTWSRQAATLSLDRPLGVMCFGRADEGAVVEEIRPPLSLDLSRPGGPVLQVLVHGPTQLVDAEGRCTLRAVTRPAAVRDHLRAWVDHVVLAASSEHGAPAMRSLVLAQFAAKTVVFPPLTRAGASAYLAGIVSELLLETHAYFLPLEAAKLYTENGGRVALADICEDLRQDPRTAVRSDYGPVPHPRSYDAPPEAEGRAMIERRLGPFFAAVMGDKSPGEAGEDPS